MVAWKTEYCATYDSGPTPGTQSTASEKSTPATTLGTQRATGTATPATPNSTVRGPDVTIAPAPANNSAQQWLLSAAV